jgi:L-2,4-diaminobutyric acid acetyltransferase
LCHHFSGTCLVAEAGDQLAGFTLAYCPPGRSDTLFVWQIGVCGTARGRGLGSRMLDELLRRHAASGVRFLEATVTPSNSASRALFESLARRQDVECQVTPLFSSEMFPRHAAHEAEHLFRIGPLSLPRVGNGTVHAGSSPGEPEGVELPIPKL